MRVVPWTTASVNCCTEGQCMEVGGMMGASLGRERRDRAEALRRCQNPAFPLIKHLGCWVVATCL
jgi:hypothetical protein